MDNFQISADNIFDSNIATLASEASYTEILIGQGMDFDDQELDLMQAFLGKGPDIYFNC